MAIASACAPTARESNLPRPLFYSFSGDGNCGSTSITDGRGDVWHEGGCEEGDKPYEKTARLSSDEMIRFRRMLDRLRAVPDVDRPACPTGHVGYAIVETSGAQRRWIFCTSEGEAVAEAIAHALDDR
jgi:hypothetical protein